MWYNPSGEEFGSPSKMMYMLLQQSEKFLEALPKVRWQKIRKDSFTKMGKVYIRSRGIP